MKFFRYWNWKSAVFSALTRAPIFLVTTVRYGWKAAAGAVSAEFLFRLVASGFFGALTQRLANLRPAWLTALVFIFVFPVLGHLLEYLIHSIRGTPNLKAGILGSIGLTVISTLFNWYVMRHGALLTGAEGRSFASDLKSMPRLLAGFAAAGPAAFWRASRRAWQKRDGIRPDRS